MGVHDRAHGALAHNEEFRFGSARFADEADITAAGMFDFADDALFAGFYGRRPLWYHGAGGVLCTAGARAGKLRDFLAYNICSGTLADESLVCLDPKGELAAISENLTPDRKYALYWQPSGGMGTLAHLPVHRLNPLDHIYKGSPTIWGDIKTLAENKIVSSGGGNSAFFEETARRYFEPFAYIITELDGVLTYPRLYQVLNSIPGGGEEYLDIAFELRESGVDACVRIEEEIAAARENPGNGFMGVLSELLRSVACLSDVRLMESLSPPYDASLRDLCTSDRRYQVYLMPEPQHLTIYAPVIKAFFVNALTHRARHPAAPRQTHIFEELAQIGQFPLAAKMFSVGAGLGCRPVAIYQSSSQLNATAPNADAEIPASAQLRMAFAIRDLPSARTLSAMAGVETLEFDDEPQQRRAAYARDAALTSLILDEADPFAAAETVRLQADLAVHRTKQHRALLSPDEILNLDARKMLLFADNLPGPILADRRPYFEERFMAGRYFPNPFHPPVDRVAVRTRWGRRVRRVITAPAPDRLKDYPQYRGTRTWRKLV